MLCLKIMKMSYFEIRYFQGLYDNGTNRKEFLTKKFAFLFLMKKFVVCFDEEVCLTKKILFMLRFLAVAIYRHSY